MTEKSEKQKRRWFSRAMKIFLFAAVFLFIIFTVMANVGGSSDNLKRVLEEYAGDYSGYQSKVGTLNNMSFFPRIAVDFENMELYSHDPSFYDPVAYIDKARVSLSFWDVFMSNGKFQDFYVEGFRALPGTFTGKALSIKEFSVRDLETGEAVLKGEGFLGDVPIQGEIKLEREGRGRHKKYRFGQIRPFRFDIGQTRIEGRLEDNFYTALRLEDFHVSHAGQDVMEGRFTFVSDEARQFNMDGELAMAERGSVFKPAVKFDLQDGQRTLSGTVRADQIYKEEFAEGSRIRQVFAALENNLGLEEAENSEPDDAVDTEDMRPADQYSGWSGQVTLTAEKLYCGDVTFENLNVDLAYEEGGFSLSEIRVEEDGQIMRFQLPSAEAWPFPFDADLSCRGYTVPEE